MEIYINEDNTLLGASPMRWSSVITTSSSGKNLFLHSIKMEIYIYQDNTVMGASPDEVVISDYYIVKH